MKELIAKIDFFSGLDDKILKKLADASIMRQYTRNETIVRQGEMGLGLYVISRGHVKVDREQAGVKMQVAELGPESFFGEMSLLDNKPRSATVTSTEDTECLLLTRDSFVKLMGKYPEIPIRMARVLAERLRLANEKLAAAPAPPAAPAASQAAGKAAPASAAAAQPANGTAAAGANVPATASPDGAKAKVHKTLLEAFESLYTMKALTRFSVAVLGCPVEGSAANTIDQFVIGDVKVLVFPADESVDLRITAFDEGSFTLDVFTPDGSGPNRLGPMAIAPGQDVIARWGGGSSAASGRTCGVGFPADVLQ
jgi:CRP/FNR family transcriptional regulator, cyclic AMP receptor protein